MSRRFILATAALLTAALVASCGQSPLNRAPLTLQEYWAIVDPLCEEIGAEVGSRDYAGALARLEEIRRVEPPAVNAADLLPVWNQWEDSLRSQEAGTGSYNMRRLSTFGREAVKLGSRSCGLYFDY